MKEIDLELKNIRGGRKSLAHDNKRNRSIYELSKNDIWQSEEPKAGFGFKVEFVPGVGGKIDIGYDGKDTKQVEGPKE